MPGFMPDFKRRNKPIFPMLFNQVFILLEGSKEQISLPIRFEISKLTQFVFVGDRSSIQSLGTSFVPKYPILQIVDSNKCLDIFSKSESDFNINYVQIC
jgi:hypothetical protein